MTLYTISYRVYMNLSNIAFYNLGAIENIPGLGENGLVRIPEEVRNQLNESARKRGMDSVGIEIRFVTDAPNIDLYVSTQKPEFGIKGAIRIFKGNFQYQVLEVETGIINFFRITPPASFPIANIALLSQGGFSPDVWRIVCDRSTVILHGINTHGHNIRPPEKNELPTLNWLAYGSSITNSHLDGYPHFAAAKMKVQVQNMGLAGACHIEKEIVDYMLDKCSFDFFTCELGINMRHCFSPGEFKERVEYLIGRLVKHGKPALIITIIPNCQTEGYTAAAANNITAHETEFNNILIKYCEDINCPTVQLMHGYDLLDDLNGLSADLIHPTLYGHAVMGQRLSGRLKNFLGNLGYSV